MAKSEVLKYLDDMTYFMRHQDEHGLAALQKESREKYVTLEDVGQAFIQLVDEMAQYVDMSQAVTETRLKDIVSKLPEETQMKIYASFIEADDDLFIEEIIEGEENDNE